VIEMAGFSSLANKAREMFNKRGGTEAAKEDLQELKDIHARGGSMSDKAKAAVDALKEPGLKGPDRSAPPDEQTRAREGRSGPERR
jgi:general stress protein YciG